MNRTEFIKLRNQYLTSAQPIESIERLKGRDKLFQKLTNALETPGRHCFIYGLRGVGKTSLAHTAAHKVQSSHGAPVIVSCDDASTFESVCNDIVRTAININKLEKKGQFKLNLGVPSIAGLEYSRTKKEIESYETELKSASGMANIMEMIISRMSVGLIIVIDEFDLLKDKDSHRKFASLVKIVSDRNIDIKFIFCGISTSVEELFDAHESINRQIIPIEVERLKIQSCLDILTDASNVLQIEIQDGFKYRIAMISDGFPAFVHLIAEKIFTQTFENSLKKVNGETYSLGLSEAAEDQFFTFRRKYEKYSNLYNKAAEHILWALANNKLLTANTEEIFSSYEFISSQLNINPIPRLKLSQRLSILSKNDAILERTQRSIFQFKDQMMRPYARLRAEHVGLKLGPEHPEIVANAN